MGRINLVVTEATRNGKIWPVWPAQTPGF
jgi:hypothetical protein